MNTFAERLGNNKLNSFWYYDETIATYESEHRWLICEAKGEIEVYLPKSLDDDTEELFKGVDAVLQAELLEYTDEDIEFLLLEDKFRLNNWFGFEYTEGVVEITMDSVSSDYEEAIEMTQEYIGEFPEEENF